MRLWERPKKELVKELNKDEEGNPITRMRLKLFTERGKLYNYVVQLEHLMDCDWKEVVRFNYSHGFVHKDIYNKEGKQVRKIDLGHFANLKDAVDMAETDINQNHEKYIRRFRGE
jgi:hypothetical protein